MNMIKFFEVFADRIIDISCDLYRCLSNHFDMRTAAVHAGVFLYRFTMLLIR
jgi:hypothetical protein